MDREDLSIGLSAERTFVVTDAAVLAFAEVTGDRNPVHLDEAYASKSLFRGRVAHGMLLGGYISAVLGEQLPGPGSAYLSQTLTFEHPVRIGDEVLVRITVNEIDQRTGRATLEAVCLVGGRSVCHGEAVVVAPRRRRARSEGPA